MAAQLVLIGETWLWIGALVAAVFLTVGIDRIDEDAQGSYVFRPLLIPGVLLIWPLVLWRWVQIERRGEVTMARYHPVRRAHTSAALAMSIVVVLFLAAGWSAKQDWPTDIPPVQMSTGS